MLVARRQQQARLALVRRRGHHHVGHAAQEGDVVVAGVGRAVGAHQAGAVQREGDIQVLQRHVVHQLIVAALQEGGIDGHHGLLPLTGQPGGERHGVLLGDAHVEIALREALLELDQPAALAHGRRDAPQPLVALGHVAQPLAEHLREGLAGRRLGLLDADGGVELARAVVEHGIGLGQLVALAFAGDHVQELQARQRPQVLQGGHQGVEVVAVDRADVVESELLEQRRRRHHALGVLFEPARQLQHRRHMLQHRPPDILGRGVELPGHQPRQIAIERAHRRRNRHVVVVQHDQQVDVGRDPRVVHGLEGHARGHGAVADDGDVLALHTGVARGHGHAQRRGNRGGRMRGAEGVVLGLAALGKTRDAALLAQVRHAFAAAGQDLVRIRLMAHVPDDAVMRRVEDIMQRQRQLDRAQVRRQVAARARHRLEHEAAQLVGQPLEFAAVQLPEVGRG
ncbi:Uncharacterised protein [Bordetella pertussis]|nr:Uncharacterised protein [Bordetella pertussis]CPQ90148.1 Uncharacterised protein [Bordetella pertussis]